MDVENSADEKNSGPNQKEYNHVNGMNGYSDNKPHHKSSSSSHKSEHKDKHRDKDRDKDREKHRDKDKDKSKEHKSSSKDKERHSSSSSKDKDRHSSSHHKSSKDKDKHRDKDREREKDKESDRDKSKSDEKKKEHKSSSHDKEHKSSKDKEKRDKDKEREKDKEKRDKERDKDKHKHSSSSKDKDKHKDKENRDKEKDRHHSSSKDKERRDKDKDRKSDKHNSSSANDSTKKIKNEDNEITKVKEEPNKSIVDSADEDYYKSNIKDEPEDINMSAASSCDYNYSQFSKNEPRFETEDENNDSMCSQDIKEENEESDEDVPLASRMSNSNTMKRKMESEDEDDMPLIARKKPKKEKKKEKKVKKRDYSEDEDEWDKPVKKEKKAKVSQTKVKKEEPESPKKGRKKKEEEEQEVWKWWEEEKKDDGVKWRFLEHKGPIFAPPYEPLPDNVKFYYDGKEMKLSPAAEEVAGFYAKMLDHDYTTKDVFNNNFFKDWRKVMSSKEREKITDLSKCNFKAMHAYFMDVAEKNRNRSKEEKKALKEKNEELLKEYGFCNIDGHKEKIGNFKIEPPGLFRGRGEHPKMGKLKRRVEAEDIIINCSKDSKIPQPPPGHKWKEVRHDNTVTWLASWTENVQNQVKYIMLNPSSKLKGEKDWQKYETARKLHKCIDKIRREYREDWKSKEMRIRQRAVALYFIDKLALRAGNEKDEDQADTVGCCSLRVEHIELHERKDDKEYVVVFDFLGKDSIRYYNEVPVEKRVFKNLQLFMENKSPGDDLFDRLNTTIMNKHLNELMEGLTAKVFRTYNASWTLQQQLDLLTNPDDSVAEKILSYNRANRAVAVLCNHQRSIPKSHQKSMEKLKEKIEAKKDAIKDAERQVKDAQRDAKHGSVKEKTVYEKKKKQLERLREQLTKLEIQETDRDENKTIALGTSKLNYLDPRISVAWCKKYDVPIEKIYNKTQRDKFRWAIDMAGPDYRF